MLDDKNISYDEADPRNHCLVIIVALLPTGESVLSWINPPDPSHLKY